MESASATSTPSVAGFFLSSAPRQLPSYDKVPLLRNDGGGSLISRQTSADGVRVPKHAAQAMKMPGAALRYFGQCPRNHFKKSEGYAAIQDALRRYKCEGRHQTIGAAKPHFAHSEQCRSAQCKREGLADLNNCHKAPAAA